MGSPFLFFHDSASSSVSTVTIPAGPGGGVRAYRGFLEDLELLHNAIDLRVELAKSTQHLGLKFGGRRESGSQYESPQSGLRAPHPWRKAKEVPVDPRAANIYIFVDSCAFDPTYAPEDASARELFALRRQGKLRLILSHSALDEIEHPNTPEDVKREASKMIYTPPVPLAPEETAKLDAITMILANNGSVERIRQDARHVFDAQRQGSYFVTADAGIIKRRDALRALVAPCEILLPSEMLARYEEMCEE